MIVIDENADINLLRHLENIRNSEEKPRLIHFKLANNSNANSSLQKSDNAAKKETIIAALQRNLPERELQLYICDDGDLIATSPAMPIKEAKLAMLDAANILGAKADDNFASIYELSSQINQLIINLTEKIEARHKEREKQIKQREQALAERKRNNILNSNIPASLINDLNNRRQSRTTPAIMVIEDDAFSRRLVENVLHNQFTITALATAELALETYAKIAPDLLFLDINLPSVTGIELLEKIINFDPEAYVIMLSGNADKDNVIAAMKLGAKGFVGKPFTREKLFQYINRCPTIRNQLPEARNQK